MTSTITEPLKNRLRLWRVHAGLTQQEMSDLTGVSPSMLSRLERGERGASFIVKVRMARSLGVRVADLFDVEEVSDNG